MPRGVDRGHRGALAALRLYNSYGLTEFTSVSHLLEPGDLAEHADTVGRPVPGAQQRVVGDGRQPAAARRDRQLMLAGPEPDEEVLGATATRTSEAHPRPLARHRRSRQRRATTVSSRSPGRASEVINRGGEKVSPLQVEAALSLVPEVAEAAVRRRPASDLRRARGRVRRAARPAATRRAGGARRTLARRVADYAIPERFFVLDQLPRGSTGKVDRQALCAPPAAVSAEATL